MNQEGISNGLPVTVKVLNSYEKSLYIMRILRPDITHLTSYGGCIPAGSVIGSNWTHNKKIRRKFVCAKI